MVRLPDIRLEDWWQDQQERFQRSTAGLLPSLEFELGARDAEAQIPPDFDAVGGLDQWELAEQNIIERESRLAQQQAEERRAQEIDAQAEHYRQMQAQAEQERQTQEQERERSVMDLIRGLGIPTPGEAFGESQEPVDNTSSTGVFDVSAPGSIPREPEASPVDQFNSFASGMFTDAFGVPTPDPGVPPPDNESTTGMLDRVGEAITSAPGRFWEDTGAPLVRTIAPKRSLGESLSGAIERDFQPRSPESEVDRMMREAPEPEAVFRPVEEAVSGAATQTESSLGLRPGSFRQAFEDVSGVLGPETAMLGMVSRGGAGKFSQKTIQAIKNLIDAGLDDDSILALERRVAEQADEPLSVVQRLTRGVPEPVPVVRSAEEAAELPTSRPSGLPETSSQASLPGFEDVPVAPGRTVATESERAFEESTRSWFGERRSLRRDERVKAAAEMLDANPEQVDAAIRRNLDIDPYTAGVEQAAIRQRAEDLFDEWDNARQEWLGAKQEMDDWIVQNPGKSAKEIDADLANDVAYWFSEVERISTELFPTFKAQTLGARAASKQMNAQRGGRLGAIAEGTARMLSSVSETAGEAAEAVRRVLRSPDGIIDQDAAKKLGELGTKLKSDRVRKAVSEGGGKVKRELQGFAGQDRQETLAERLGRLKREQGRFERMDQADPNVKAQLDLVRYEIEETIQQATEEATELARRNIEGRPGRAPTTAEEADRVIDAMLGRRTISKIRREELARQKGHWPKDVRDLNTSLDKALRKALQDEQRLFDSIDRQVQRRIDGALAAEDRKQTRAEVKKMADDARSLVRTMRQHPDDPAFRSVEEQFDLTLRQLEAHSNVGQRVAGELRDRLWENLGRDLTRREELGYQRGLRAIDDARLRAVQSQIQTVLENPRAPDRHTRMAELLQDLSEINTHGAQRATDMRRRAYMSGIQKSGLFAEDVDKETLVKMMASIDPSRPETFRAVAETMKRPNVWNIFREISFINMLSRPTTHLTNITSTLANAGLQGILRNPIEQIVSGGELSGTGAGAKAFWGATKEGARLARETMGSGINPRRLENVVASGDYRHVGNEVMPRFLGSIAGSPGRWWGAKMHQISTRPLEAMDAMLGHMAYSGAFAQQAQRHVDDLIREGSPKLAAMEPVGDWARFPQRERALAYIQQNPWDFPELIKAAGKIEDYTLFRSRGQGPVEQRLRMLMGLKEVPPDAPLYQHAGAAVLDFIIPFWNVPYNFTKQGLGNVAHGAASPFSALEVGRRLVTGDKKGAGELAARATQGAMMLGIPAMFAMGDNLTGPGPTDEADRRVWLQTHEPNSWRPPGTTAWISYEGTPWAIPFALVAGIKEGYEFKQIDREAPFWEQLATGGLAAARGAVKGALSQSFLDSAIRNAALFAGEVPSPQSGASILSGAALRYAPSPVPTGMLDFLAGMFDTVEREAGRARDIGDIPEVVPNQILARLPGTRDDLPARRGAFGEVRENERSGLRALVPRSILPVEAPGGDDPIARQLQRGSVGIPQAPKELVVGQSRKLPLTIQEQQDFQRYYGEAYRQLLEKKGAGEREFSVEKLEEYRTMARERAAKLVERQIPLEERRRRSYREAPVKVAP